MVALVYLAAFYVAGRPITGLGGGRGVTALAAPRVGPLLFLAAAAVFLTVWRLVVTRLLASDALRHRALVVGAGEGGGSFVAELAGVSHPYQLVGFLDDDPEKAGTRVAGLPVLCTRDGLVETVRRLDVQEVVLATRRALHPDLLRELLRCYEQGVRIRPMPAAIEELTGRVPVEHLGQKWFLAPFWNEVGLPLLQAAAKRALDVVVAVVGLTLAALVLPAVVVALKLDSRGPVFYRQERLARGGRPFRLIKFRSMIAGAEREGEALWAQHQDPRITRLGWFLRRTRLDELPQFWNVLRGEMSVVGPRPERPSFIEQLEREIPFYRMRLAVKPGLTGWAQINQPYANSVAEALRKLEFDLYYVKNQSLLLDVLIILRTLGVVATFRGH
jgi:exopolysaccharide biosynthesis polyprenyl glycosylphosphotransferase